MDGPTVFKKAVEKFPEVIMEALNANGLQPTDINLLIPHQANLRISQFVQKKLRLADSQVFNNIQKFGNTTAASIPIALCEAWEQGNDQRRGSYLPGGIWKRLYLGQRFIKMVVKIGGSRSIPATFVSTRESQQ